MTLKYVDVNGKERTIVLIGDGYYVEWYKDYPPGTSHRYRLEDGSIVQIPDNAWEILGIKKYDS